MGRSGHMLSTTPSTSSCGPSYCTLLHSSYSLTLPPINYSKYVILHFLSLLSFFLPFPLPNIFAPIFPASHSIFLPLLTLPPSHPPSCPLSLLPSRHLTLPFSFSLLLLLSSLYYTFSLPFNHLNSHHLYSHPYFHVFSVRVLCVLYVYIMCLFGVFRNHTGLS